MKALAQIGAWHNSLDRMPAVILVSPLLNYFFLEQLKSKLEKIIGIEKHAGKVRKYLSLQVNSCKKNFRPVHVLLVKFDIHFILDNRIKLRQNQYKNLDRRIWTTLLRKISGKMDPSLI